jgi:hypothetical protein
MTKIINGFVVCYQIKKNVDFFFSLFRKPYAVYENGNTETSHRRHDERQNKPQDFICVKLNNANRLTILSLIIKDEDGVELYCQKVDNIKEKILINACNWRNGLYSASIRQGGVSCVETLFFLFGQKKVMILLNDDRA